MMMHGIASGTRLEKPGAIRPIPARETVISVFRHHGSPIEGPQKLIGFRGLHRLIGPLLCRETRVSRTAIVFYPDWQWSIIRWY